MALNIIWVGNPFFHRALEGLGHHVSYIPIQGAEVYTWEQLVARSGMSAPDAVVVADQSRPPFVVGMEHFPCLTALYCVDSHVHSWFPRYAQGFDLCFVSLKDHIPLFHAPALPSPCLTPEQIAWLPPYLIGNPVDEESASLPEKDWSLLFVGSVNPVTMPERSAFLHTLGNLVPGLHCCRGNFHELFPKGSILLNHCAARDLNFRFFEALGCGGCLLAPRIGHGLEELFTDGEDLFLYENDNAPDAAAVARHLLQHPCTRKDAAASGLEKVRHNHLAVHRARQMDMALAAMLGDAGINRIRQRQMNAFAIWETHLRVIYLLMAKNLDIAPLREAYLRAGSRTHAGVSVAEPHSKL